MNKNTFLLIRIHLIVCLLGSEVKTIVNKIKADINADTIIDLVSRNRFKSQSMSLSINTANEKIKIIKHTIDKASVAVEICFLYRAFRYNPFINE